MIQVKIEWNKFSKTGPFNPANVNRVSDNLELWIWKLKNPGKFASVPDRKSSSKRTGRPIAFGKNSQVTSRVKKAAKQLQSAVLGFLQKRFNFNTSFIPWFENTPEWRRCSEYFMEELFDIDGTSNLASRNKLRQRYANFFLAGMLSAIFNKKFGISNKVSTAKAKGFNHFLVDTGETYRNLKTEFVKKNV